MTSFPIRTKNLFEAGQVYRIAIYRECSLGAIARERKQRPPLETARPVSLLRGERGQKERDERTCARVRV
jgi:hypothetical protein